MAKADFDDVYASTDPRRYYQTLAELDYEVPTHSAELFGQIAQHLQTENPDVLDLCCSYGINATVMNHDIDFSEVIDHYTDTSAAHMDREHLLARDREWFSQRAVNTPLPVSGLDTSKPAIDYAVQAGLLETGYAEDLEASEPSGALADRLSAADLISVSGGIGYVTETTIGRILDHGDCPWVAALCLRWVDFQPIAKAAAGRGMVTERLDDTTFRQRRFADDAEEAHVLSELRSMGIDTEGREAEGWHHTDFYLVRPEESAAERPLSAMLTPHSGHRSPEAGSRLQVTVL